jgi:cytidylate kinase
MWPRRPEAAARTGDMTVITLSGGLGGGAAEIGQVVARRLAIDYVDREVLVEAARYLSLTPEELATKEAPSPTSLGARLGRLLRGFVEKSARAGAWDPTSGDAGLEYVLGRTYAEAMELAQGGEVDDETYIATIKAVIVDLASKQSMVLVGRGGQAILRDSPRALHVLLICPQGLRASRIAEREGMSMEEAMQRVAESDRARIAFHKKYFKIDVDDPRLYHMVLNTSRFSYEDGAAVLLTASRLQAPHTE